MDLLLPICKSHCLVAYRLTFNILLCDLKAVIMCLYSSYSFIVVPCENLWVLFYAIPMPSICTVLTFLNSYIHYVNIAPSTLFNVFAWVSPSYVAVSEYVAYLRMLGPIMLHVRYETILKDVCK